MSRLLGRRSGVVASRPKVVVPPEAPLPAVLNDGFESGNLSAWTTVVTSASGLAEVISGAARSGNFGFRAYQPSSGGVANYARLSFAARDEVGMHGWFRWNIAGPSGNNSSGFRIFAGSTRIADVYRDNSTGVIWLRWASTGATTYSFLSSGVTAALSTWTEIELKVRYGAGGTSRLEVLIGGVSRILTTTATLWSGGFTIAQLGCEHNSQPMDWHADDVTVRLAPGTFHVDSAAGSNGSGTQASPINSISTVNSLALMPGDAVLFKRGSVFAATLASYRNGTAAAPIRFGAYGSGTAPIFDGGGNFANGNPLNPIPGPWPTQGSRTPIEVRGDWQIIENLIAQQANWGGVDIFGDDAEVRFCEIRWNVAGLRTRTEAGRSNIHDNSIHDNNVMSVNAPFDGVDEDTKYDDSGAFGMVLFGYDGDIHHNTIFNHRATSYDFGFDGSACEFYGGKFNRVHHNYAYENECFTELGHRDTEGNVYDHNLIVVLSGTGRIGFNVQGVQWGGVLDTSIHHNTIYMPGGSNQGIIVGGSGDLWTASTSMSVGARRVPAASSAQNNYWYEVTVAGTTGSTPPAWPTTINQTVTDGTVTWKCRAKVASVRNNICVTGGKHGYSGHAIEENNNVFWGNSTQQLRSVFSASKTGQGPQSTAANPLFVADGSDFHLTAGSPAVNRGVDLSYTDDYAGDPRLIGGAPDAGVYERQ